MKLKFILILLTALLGSAAAQAQTYTVPLSIFTPEQTAAFFNCYSNYNKAATNFTAFRYLTNTVSVNLTNAQGDTIGTTNITQVVDACPPLTVSQFFSLYTESPRTAVLYRESMDNFLTAWKNRILATPGANPVFPKW